ncbi:MAG: lysylphosphatidylglycerol synthase transmembrane domain-containing protein [Acidobacteriota bacterium]
MKLSRVAKLLITGGLLFWVLRSIDMPGLRINLAALDFRFIILLLFAYWAAQLISVQRWRILAAALGVSGPYASFLRVYFAGMFLGIGLTSLGGDILKSYALSKQPASSLSIGVASVLLDRAAGLATLLLIGTAASVLRPAAWHGIPLIVVYASGWAAAAGLGATALRRELSGVRSRLRLTGGTVAAVSLLSLANTGIVLWIVERLFADLGSPVPWAAMCSLVPVIEILTLLPISVSGLGIREWAYLEAFALAGVPPGAALAAALAMSALILVRNMAGLFFIGAFRHPEREAG